MTVRFQYFNSLADKPWDFSLTDDGW